MRIGILSDTHDRLDAMKAGMKVLEDHGAEFFIHCGDVGGEKILDCFIGKKSVFVWGNCDCDRVGLERYAAELGLDCRGVWGELEFAGKKIAVTHGDDGKLLRRALAGHHYDYLLHGHTHIVADERIDGMRIINPGALFRAATKTVATLDLENDNLVILPVLI
jgi:putative phosphoesterase